MIKFLGLSAAICGSDLAIKSTVKEKVALNIRKDIVKDKVILTKFYNKGAALGFMSDHPELLKGITIFSVGSLAGALSVVSGLKGHALQKVGFSMILGGAGSNAYERLRYGKVTDYIRLNMGSPKCRRVVYNLGDFAIFAGTALLLLGECFELKK